jgi:hypothetical protein
LPRLLSNAADAPYLGEAAILFNLTRPPATGFPVQTGGQFPKLVSVSIVVQILIGVGGIIWCWVSLRRWLREPPSVVVPAARAQFWLWLTLILGSVLLYCFGESLYALVLLLLAQFLPRFRKKEQKAITGAAHSRSPVGSP